MNDASAALLLRQLFDVAVARAHPRAVLPAHLPEPPAGRTVVIGAGKASGAMAQALEVAWPGDAPLGGVVVTRYGHVPPAADQRAPGEGRIRLLQAAHPVPDEAGLHATEAIVRAVQGLTGVDLVIAIMSGGGSALLAAPPDGCTLQDEQELHRQLLRCGAPITAMNTVRRHVSAIKGGRLAACVPHVPMLTLAISDVPGDRLEDIASGPTVPDPTTCPQALEVMERYRLAVPPAVHDALRNGTLETPKPGDPVFARHRARLIATPMDMLQAAAQAAREAGHAAHVLSDRIEGEASEVGRAFAALAQAMMDDDHALLHRALHALLQRDADDHAAALTALPRPCVVLSGGETTVTLPAAASPGASSQGRHAPSGGRCSEMLLAAACALQGRHGTWMLACDTDGIDGNGDAAGAIVSPGTWARAAAQGLDASAMLAEHASGAFFKAIGEAVVTGPTYTNVNDFRALLIHPCQTGDAKP